MWIRICLFFLLTSRASGQRFLREGFSNQMQSDFQGEMKLDENDSASGMSREMFLMKDTEWELQNLDLRSLGNGKLRRHLESFFDKPVTLKLSTRKGRYGLRAIGRTQSGKALRAFWRQKAGSSSVKGDDYLKSNYDEAIRSRLATIEFEMQLPPVERRSKVLPSLVVSVPVEPGTMNPRAIIPRGSVTVKVLPEGHATPDIIDIGNANVNIPMKTGIVDVGWAKGRSIFRCGRSNGIV